MALKIIQRPQIWHTHLYCECLDPYWFSSWLGNFWPSGGQKHLKGGVTRAPSQQKVFRTFFVHVVRYQFETWHIHLVGDVTRQIRVSSHLSAFMALKIILRPQIWYTHSNSECLDPYWLLSCLGMNTGKGELVELPASDTWGLSFIRIRSLPLQSFLDFFSKCCAISTWKLVYTLSRLQNILSSCFTRMGPCDLHVLSLGTVD